MEQPWETFRREATTPPKYCVTCGKPLEGHELKQYCCDEHEAAYQAEATIVKRYGIHEQPYLANTTSFYDRDTGAPRHAPASKYGPEFQAPPNPYLK